MNVVSVAEATRHLGIDAKTLHRWLTEAQLPLQDHPHDGRKKGVSREQLERLASLHQRSLAPQREQPPEPAAASDPPALPAELLALPQALAALQAQIAALQQQMAALTLLLQPPTAPPATPAAATRQSKKSGRPPTPAPSAPRARSASGKATKPPGKPVHVLPRVEYGSEGHYVVICPKKGRLPFELDSVEWFDWLKEQSSFRFVGQGGFFTAHHEWRVKKGAWRAHRHIRNHSYTLRLTPVQDLTIAVLEQAAAALQAHLT